MPPAAARKSSSAFTWSPKLALEVDSIPKLIDAKTTVAEHISRMRKHGDSYILSAMHPVLPPKQRATALKAALKLLTSKSQSSKAGSIHASSQILTQTLSQRPMIASQSAHGNSCLATANAVASAIDGDLPNEVLIEAIDVSVKRKILPVLIKTLCVLVTLGSVKCLNDKSTDLADVDGSELTEEIMEVDAEDESDMDDDDKPLQQTANSTDLNKQRNASMSNSSKKTGQNFVDNIVSKIIKSDTMTVREDGDDVFFVVLARETPLSKAVVPTILDTLIQRLPFVNIFELPAYVYQLILFSSYRCSTSLKRRTLRCVVEHFAFLEQKSMEHLKRKQYSNEDEEIEAVSLDIVDLTALRQIQGTTLIHVDFALKQDPSLVSEVLRLARDGADSVNSILSPFGMALMLALARTPSLQSTVLATVSSVISRHRREMEFRQASLFAACLAKDDSKIFDPEMSLLHAAKNTVRDGWDHISDPLVLVCFALLDRSKLFSAKTLLGDILELLFHSHDSLRAEILEQLLSRVVLQEKSSIAALIIIKRLAHQDPIAVLGQGRRIKDSLEDLTTLLPCVSCYLIDCYKPLLQVRPDLEDFLILALRKALFYREESTRILASCGFLRLVTPRGVDHHEASGSSSGGRTVSKGQMMKDVIQPLRRALTHQATVRAAMYAEIRQVIRKSGGTTSSTGLCVILRSLLYPHFLRFIDASQAPFVNIDRCVDERGDGRLIEPLGELILTLACIEMASNNTLFSKSYLVELAKKVSTVVIQDFSIAKESPVPENGEVEESEAQEGGSTTSANIAARANRNKARLLGSIVESLIHTLLSIEDEHKSAELFSENLVPLLTLRNDILDILKQLGSRGRNDMKADVGQLDQGDERSGTLGTVSSTTGKKSKKRSSKVDKAHSSQDANSSEFAVLHAIQPLIQLPVLVKAMSNLAQLQNREVQGISSWANDARNASNVTNVRHFLYAAIRSHLDQYASILADMKKRAFSNLSADLECFATAICTLIEVYMADFARFRSLSDPAHSKLILSALGGVRRCLDLLSSSDSSSASLMQKASCAFLPPNHEALHCEDAMISVNAAVKALQLLIKNLLVDNRVKETRAALAIVAGIGRMRKQCGPYKESLTYLDSQAAWGREVLRTTDFSDSDIAKQLAEFSMSSPSGNGDLVVASQMATKINSIVGDCEAENNNDVQGEDIPDPDSLVQCEAIKPTNAFAVADVILDAVDNALSEAEWGVGRSSSLKNSPKIDSSTESQAAYLLKLAQTAESTSHGRLCCAVNVLGRLTRCAIGKWKLQERIVKSVTRCYKVLSLATKLQAASKTDPRESFVELIDSTKIMGPHLWTFLSFLGSEQEQPGRANLQSQRASKEARIMPLLIYEAERFEKLLIACQRHTKINLLKGMKRNTARDFRISRDLLSEEENDESDDDRPLSTRNLMRNTAAGDNSTNEPQRKKRRSS